MAASYMEEGELKEEKESPATPHLNSGLSAARLTAPRQLGESLSSVLPIGGRGTYRGKGEGPSPADVVDLMLGLAEWVKGQGAVAPSLATAWGVKGII